MPFVTDKQTLDDLNLTGKYRNNSVFNLFNGTKTAGGERLLEAMFREPLTNETEINKRSHIFRYFQSKDLDFPFDQEQLSIAENFLSGVGGNGLLGTAAQTTRRKALFYMGLKQEYDLVNNGLSVSLKILQQISQVVNKLLQQDPRGAMAETLQNIKKIFEENKLSSISSETGHLSFLQSIRYDHLLRVALRNEMTAIMQFIHELDLNIAVAVTARKRGFTYATALPAHEQRLEMEEVFHPGIEKAVANSVELDANSNMIFLTGANMAGKSTYMKSFGIAVYLAHMGFPVPARSMVFSVKEGIYTSINVPDNLNMGYSHFYAEVLRVKNIAQEVSRPKNLVVIFDELFKGTNVKDAYDATLAVSEAFGAHRNCFFIISTHIVEVGEVLKQRSNNVQFTYMPTEMKGSQPVYTYRSATGISSDRHGMMIIQNEKILEMIG